jgi:thiol-disulfide isomerase/thioredoxin
VKKILILLSCIAHCHAQSIPATPVKPATPAAQEKTEAPAVTLLPGSEVDIKPILAARSIQGKVAENWEPGKLYLLECWATWCGPCIAAIPHVNELHVKYRDKGLRVIGMNVWEDGEEKVSAFVKKKGKGMSYPVLYVGKSGAFENEWLKAAGVTGIPTALLVRDGKFLLKTHPSQLTDEVIQSALEGDEGIKKLSEAVTAMEKKRSAMMANSRAFYQAMTANNVEEMNKHLEEAKALGLPEQQIQSMVLRMAITQKDWASIQKHLDAATEKPMSGMFLYEASNVVLQDDTAPESLVKTIATRFDEVHSAMRTGGMAHINQSRLQWRAGDKDAALASAKKAVEESQKPESKPMRSEAIATKFLKAVEAGTMPDNDDIKQWYAEMREQAVKEAAANRANQATKP